MGGSLSTFLIALGEILSIFIYIFGFHWKILPILMFGLHFGLGYFCIFGRNSCGQNGAQTSRSVKFFNEIQKYIHPRLDLVNELVRPLLFTKSSHSLNQIIIISKIQVILQNEAYWGYININLPMFLYLNYFRSHF